MSQSMEAAGCSRETQPQPADRHARIASTIVCNHMFSLFTFSSTTLKPHGELEVLRGGRHAGENVPDGGGQNALPASGAFGSAR